MRENRYKSPILERKRWFGGGIQVILRVLKSVVPPGSWPPNNVREEWRSARFGDGNGRYTARMRQPIYFCASVSVDSRIRTSVDFRRRIGPVVAIFFALASVSAAQNPPMTQPSRGGAMPDLMPCLRLIRDKQFEAARAQLVPIAAAHPRWARATFMLGLTYHEEARYEMAKPHFEKAIALDPNDLAFRPFYGWCLYYLGEGDASRAQFETYLEAKPDYADAHFAIGLIAYEEDDLDEAVTRFNRTIASAVAAKDARTEGKARARLGDVYIRRDELVKAREELLKAVELRPDAYEAYFKLSRVFERLGDRDKAKWARERHKSIYEKLYPTAPPMGGPATRPAGGD